MTIVGKVMLWVLIFSSLLALILFALHGVSFHYGPPSAVRHQPFFLILAWSVFFLMISLLALMVLVADVLFCWLTRR